jgi:hypothetical protein
VFRYDLKGCFMRRYEHSKNFSASPSCDFASPIGIKKLIKAEVVFLVKLARASIQNQKGCCAFQCLSFTTEFVGTSFDAASGFLVLKNGLRRLSDFPGHFLGGSGRSAGWFLRGFGVPGARGGSFGVTKPKRDILVAI